MADGLVRSSSTMVDEAKHYVKCFAYQPAQVKNMFYTYSQDPCTGHVTCVLVLTEMHHSVQFQMSNGINVCLTCKQCISMNTNVHPPSMSTYIHTKKNTHTVCA